MKLKAYFVLFFAQLAVAQLPFPVITIPGLRTTTTSTGSLSGPMAATDTAVPYTRATGTPANGNLIFVDSEYMTITSVANPTSLVVTRGARGTTPATHNAGASVLIGTVVDPIPVCTTNAYDCAVGSDIPQNPKYTCPYNNDPNTCLFTWTSNTAGMSRVLVAKYGGSNVYNFTQRWVDNPAITTNHSVVVNNLQSSIAYNFSLANCPGNTLTTCGQYSTGWSVWNWGNRDESSIGQIVIPPPAIAASPIMKVLGVGGVGVYPGRFTGINVQFYVSQLPPDASTTLGYGSISIAPVDSSGVIGSYTSCAKPVLTGTTDPPGGGFYKSGGDCGNNIIAYLWNGGITGIAANWPYPFRVTLADTFRTDDSNIIGQTMWGTGAATPLSQIGLAPNTQITNSVNNMNLTFWPQANATPGTYSVRASFTLFKSLIARSTGTLASSIDAITTAIPLTVPSTAHNGDIIKIDSEYMTVTDASNPSTLVVARGVFSTTAATHAVVANGVSIGIGCTTKNPATPSCLTNYPSGNTVSMTYEFKVLPPEAPLTPPPYSSLTPNPPMDPYRRLWQSAIGFAAARDCESFKTWNNFGGWNNIGFSGNYSASRADATGNWIYDGTRVHLQLRDFLRDNVTADWQANFSYYTGDFILHNGVYYQAVISTNDQQPPLSTPGLSGATFPTDMPTHPFPTQRVADTGHDNQVRWINIGALSDWNNCAYQIEQQYINMVFQQGGVEWSEFMPGRFMMKSRQGDSNAAICNAGGGCTGVESNVISGFAAPNPTGRGMSSGGTMGNWVPGTLRPVPYAMQSQIAEWLSSGVKPILWDTMLNTLLTQVEYLINVGPYDSDDTFTLDYPKTYFGIACCAVPPYFDFSLATESLILADETYFVETGAFDPGLHAEVKKIAAAQWNNYNPNALGWPYTPFQVVETGTVTSGQAFLGASSIGTFAWLWRMEGNNCALQNWQSSTTTSCVNIADTMALQSFSQSNYQTFGANVSKTNNFMFKWWDWWGWRTGTLSATDSYVMPDKNPQEPLFADSVGPFYNGAGGYMAPIPSATPDASGNVTFRWTTYEQVASASIAISTFVDNIGTSAPNAGPNQTWPPNPTHPPTMYPCPNFKSVIDPAKGFNIWINSCTISGIANGTYFWGPQGTDAAGNVQNASFAPQIQLSPIYSSFGMGGQYLCYGYGPCDACGGNGTTCTIGQTGLGWASFVVPGPPPAGTFTISGSITGLSGSTVSVNLEGARNVTVATNSSGQYSFPGLPVGSYVITPQALPGYVYTPTAYPIALTGNATIAAFVAAIPTYSISGTITGTVQVGVPLQLTSSNLTTPLTTTSGPGGSYSFGNLNNGTYTITPLAQNYTFSPPSITVTISGANSLSNNFTATGTGPLTYQINGKITGTVSAGITVNLSGTATATTTTDTNGNYAFNGIANGSYTITPVLAGTQFSPTSAAITVQSTNVTQNFTSQSPVYSMSGTVTTSVNGSPLNGVSIVITGPVNRTVVSSNGWNTYVPNGSYVVTPNYSGYAFTPASRNIVINNAAVYSQNFVGTPVAGTYSISGTISGAVSSGISVNLTGSKIGQTYTDATGNYSFPGLGVGTYTVTPTLAGFIFSPLSITATISNVNITSQNFVSSGGVKSPAIWGIGHIGPTPAARSEPKKPQ